MKIIPTAIPDVLILEPQVFGDSRGFFLESFNANSFRELTGLDRQFVQDNHSRSQKNVLRGMHYQYQRPQGKLVRVAHGAVLDVAIDMRKGSPSFGKSVGVELSSDNFRMMWIPEGFAHGFLVLSESADFMYKVTDYYCPGDEYCLLWDANDVSWPWPAGSAQDFLLSEKDKRGKQLADLPFFP